MIFIWYVDGCCLKIYQPFIMPILSEDTGVYQSVTISFVEHFYAGQ